MPELSSAQITMVRSTVTAVPSDDWSLTQNIIVYSNAMIWVYVTIGIIGLLSNMFVIVVIATSRQLQTQPRNWFIFHQSIADLFSSLFIIISVTKSANMILNVSIVMNTFMLPYYNNTTEFCVCRV